MKEEVKKWITKAENDLKTAKDELATKEPATDTVCFHAQQCVEKYLKAFLVFQQKDFRKTHNIAEILSLCIETDSEFQKLQEIKVQELTIYATELRYPEFFYNPTIEEAKKAIAIAQKVKTFVLRKLRKKGLK